MAALWKGASGRHSSFRGPVAGLIISTDKVLGLENRMIIQLPYIRIFLTFFRPAILYISSKDSETEEEIEDRLI